jgi:hypothetical protein
MLTNKPNWPLAKPRQPTALKAIRTVTAEMRQRSQVLIYSDPIHAYHR